LHTHVYSIAVDSSTFIFETSSSTALAGESLIQNGAPRRTAILTARVISLTRRSIGLKYRAVFGYLPSNILYHGLSVSFDMQYITNIDLQFSHGYFTTTHY
jgi:hypothetical protein